MSSSSTTEDVTENASARSAVGVIDLEGGTGTGRASGGNVNFSGGSAAGAGNGGSVVIQTGTSSSGSPGDFIIRYNGNGGDKGATQYTWPTTDPIAGQRLEATTVSGSDPVMVKTTWVTP